MISASRPLPYPDLSTVADCHLYLVHLQAADFKNLTGHLSDWERTRAARFRFERDARRYVVSHVAMRRVLGHHLASDPDGLYIDRTALGKPFLKGHPLHFNISHSEDWALVGIHRNLVIGVDLEMRRDIPDLEQLAEQNYTLSERATMDQSSDRLQSFFDCWTRKEACLKAVGSGLSIAPKTFEVALNVKCPTVRIPTPLGNLCDMSVMNIDITPAQSSIVPMTRLHGAVALMAPQDGNRDG